MLPRDDFSFCTENTTDAICPFITLVTRSFECQLVSIVETIDM
jgi:hypothetical protein